MGIFPSLFKHTAFDRRDEALAAPTTNSIRSSLCPLFYQACCVFYLTRLHICKPEITHVVLV